tara:strand:+ start:283 stop:801 length:519 start_codon:yes stop_codon:yes gene_type:complete
MALSDIKVRSMGVTWNGQDLGSTQGGVEVSIEVQSTDIVTDQEGTAPVDAYQTGVVVTLSMTLVELNTANYNQMIATPTGNSVAGSDATVYGHGSSKNFTSMLAMAQTLRLRPTGNTTEAEDITFWKAVPIVESLAFAPDSANSMSVSFRIFKDSSKDSKVDLYAIGDPTGV